VICGQDASRGAGLNCSQGTSIARNMIGRGGRLDLENRTARLRFGAFEPAMTGRYKQDSERIVAYPHITPFSGSVRFGENRETTKSLDKNLGPTWVQLLPKTMHLGPTRRTTNLNESTS
jgi:hypothetical protein